MVTVMKELEEKMDDDKLEEEELEEVDPQEFFRGSRITLERTKDYEDALKSKMQELASKKPEVVSDIVTQFAPNTEVMRGYDMLTVVREMRKRSMFPSIFFQLNTYRCMELFMTLLDTLERRELEEYPEHYRDLERQRKEQEVRRVAAEKAQKARDAARAKKRVDEEGNTVYDDSSKGGDDPSDQVFEAFIDVTAPHPEFVLTPPNKNISLQELENLQGTVDVLGNRDIASPLTCPCAFIVLCEQASLRSLTR